MFKGLVVSIDVLDCCMFGSNCIVVVGSVQVYGQILSGYYDECMESNGQLQKMSWGFYSLVVLEQLVKVLGVVIFNFKCISCELDGNYVCMEIFDCGGWYCIMCFDYYCGQFNVLGEWILVIELLCDFVFFGSCIGCLVCGV